MSSQNNSEAKYDIKNITMMSCNEIIFDENTESYFQYKNKSEYFCPLIDNDTEIILKGNFINFVEKTWVLKIQLIFCSYIKNKKNKNCKNYKKFFEEHLNNDELYVNMVINEIKFDKDDLKIPLKQVKRSF